MFAVWIETKSQIFVSVTGQKKAWIMAKWILSQIFCTLSSQLELKTQQTQFRGGGKREKKFLLLPPLQRKRLPYMTKYIYVPRSY